MPGPQRSQFKGQRGDTPLVPTWMDGASYRGGLCAEPGCANYPETGKRMCKRHANSAWAQMMGFAS